MKKTIQLIAIFCCFTVTNLFGIVAIDTLNIEGCSQIVLKNGTTIQADVLKMSADELKYKPCGKPKEAVNSISKSEIVYVKAPNGSIAYSSEESKVEKNITQKLNENVLIGFILSIATFGIGSIPALILSIKGLNQIKDEPQKYSGRELGIAGVVLSILGTILLILYLTIILIFLAFGG